MDSITLYSSRHFESDLLLFDRFTNETGIAVKVVADGGDSLIQRLEREGAQTDADLFMTGDAGNLQKAKRMQLFQPVESEQLRKNIPNKLRDSNHEWFGLTKRARVIVYVKGRVNPSKLATYEDLATPEWEGRLRLRSSGTMYNISLLASFIETMGAATAKQWSQGIVKNLVSEPSGNDTEQLQDIVMGLGDVTIANTYYVAKMLASSNPEEVKAAERLGISFPNQGSSGTHINISGIALTKYAKNKYSAIRFIEFLSSEAIQALYAEPKFEYPVHPNVMPSELLQSWGEFQEQDIHLDVLGYNQQKAILLFDQCGWK